MKFSCNYRDCDQPAKWQYTLSKVKNGKKEVTITWRCKDHKKKDKKK